MVTNSKLCLGWQALLHEKWKQIHVESYQQTVDVNTGVIDCGK